MTATSTRPDATARALFEVNELLARSLGRLPLVVANEWGGFDYGTSRTYKSGEKVPTVRTGRDDTRITVWAFTDGINSGSIHFDGGSAQATLIAPIIAAYLAPTL